MQSWVTGAASQSPGPVNGATQSYTYDALGRVSGVAEKSGSTTVASWAYAYDPMGNRTSQTRTGSTGGGTGTETASYNAASQVTSNSYGSFTYDKNGNEVTAPGLPAMGMPARSGVVTDVLGNATAMMVGGTGQSFTYGGASPGLYNQLWSGDGKGYVRSILGLALSNYTKGTATVRYITHPSGSPVGYVAPEGQAWMLTDRLGSVIGLTDASGALIARYAYDPYGTIRAVDETNALAQRNIHRFHGGIIDKTTKLTRFGVRWYDSSTGRFTTPDPSSKEKNPYLYVNANPCNRTDSSGELGIPSLTSLGCQMSVGLLGGDISVGLHYAGVLGIIPGGGAGLAIVVGAGLAVTLAGAFLCEGV